MSETDAHPYVGLRPFKSTESIKFFGRYKQTNELLERLHEHRFLAVVGSSGCGKSSLLLAGLIPALKGGYLLKDSNQWMIAIMKPGQSPMFNLVHAILKGLGKKAESEQVNAFLKAISAKGINAIINLIAPYRIESNFNFFLLVDQFEELFRFCKEQKDINKQNEAVRFVNTILELSSQALIPFHVVLTMRSDFIGDCSQFYGLPEAMNKSQYLVPRLGRQQLKKVITGPAKLYGVKINSFLTSKLLNRLGQVQDELPVLQHALMRMWDYEKNVDTSGELDLKDFESIGGFEKALSNDANKALNELSEDEKRIAELLFKALTDIDDNGRKIRRRVNLSELKALTGASEKALLDIIDHFVKDRRSFLYVREVADTGDMLIDISHESLIRQWDKLNKWVDEESETAKFYKRLAEACRQYNLEVKEKDLLTGSELDLALEWRDNYKPSAVWANRYKGGFRESIDYLDESEVERIRLQDIDKKRTRKQKNTTRAIMGLLLLISLFAGGAYFSTKHNTRTRDFHNEAKSLANIDPTKALKKADKAVKRSGSPLGFYSKSHQFDINNTLETIYKEHSFYKILYTLNPKTIAFSPDKTITISKVDDAKYRLESRDGTIDTVFQLKDFENATFSDDGAKIFICCENNQSFTWDIQEKNKELFPKIRHEDSLIVFSPKNDRVIIGYQFMPTQVLSLDKSFKKEIPSFEENLTSLITDPSGKYIFLSSKNKHRLYDSVGNAISNNEINPYRFSRIGEISSATFSPDGQSILTGSFKKATLWGMTGLKRTEFIGHSDDIHYVKFAPNQEHIITASRDNTAILWDLGGNIIQNFIGHTKPIFSVDFSEDGNSITTYSTDNTVREWQLNNSVLNTNLEVNTEVTSVSFSLDGKSALTGQKDGGVVLWGMQENNSKKFDGLGNTVRFAGFSSDEKSVIAVAENGTAKVWNLEGENIQTFTADSTFIVRSAAISTDGKTIAMGSFGGKVLLWNLDSNEATEIYEHKGVDNTAIHSLSFSPKGKSLLIGCGGNSATIRDLELNTDLLIGHSQAVLSTAFSPDGQRFVTGSQDATAILWDIGGNEVMKFHGHSKPIMSVDFSPDGENIVTASRDGTAILWDLEGNPIQEFVGHNSILNAVRFSPDGTKIITGSNDQSARRWDIRTSLEEFLKEEDLEKSPTIGD